MTRYAYYETPFGTVRIGWDEAIESLGLVDRPGDDHDPSALSDSAAAQLQEYFAGTRTGFSLPLAPRGTPFQNAVWKALQTIPYGEVRSYGQIARAIGSPSACRAVGMACNKNPIWILIPCHRVVGSSGKLTGYAGGVDMKQALLNLEQR